jgi:hypothetical protein
LSIILRLGLYGSGSLTKRRLRTPFGQRLKLAIHQRFDDENNGAAANGIRAMGGLTWLRWLFFVFGALIPALNLMSFTGTPWTKAYGIVFFISFLVVEVLVVLSSVGDQRCPTLYDHVETAKLRSIKSQLDAIDKRLLFWASLLHALVMYWVLADILPGTDINVVRRWFGNTNEFQKVAVKTYVCMEKPVMVPLLFTSAHIIRHIVLKGFAESPFLALWMGLWLGFYVFLLRVTATGFSRLLLVDIGKFIGIGFSPLVLYPLSVSLGPSYLSAGEYFDAEQGHTGPKDPIAGGEGSLTFFSIFYALMLCLSWYAFRYDSTGTVNPGWKDMFG